MQIKAARRYHLVPVSWMSGPDIYTLPCIKQLARGKLLYSIGTSAGCSVVM